MQALVKLLYMYFSFDLIYLEHSRISCLNVKKTNKHRSSTRQGNFANSSQKKDDRWGQETNKYLKFQIMSILAVNDDLFYKCRTMF